MKNPKQKQEINELFVYGTLRSGESRNYVLNDLKFSKAELPGYKKVEPSSLGFPFIVKVDNKNITVDGEIYYNLKPEHWKMVDKIEGEGSLYHRIKVTVVTADNEEVICYTYYPSEGLINQFIH